MDETERQHVFFFPPLSPHFLRVRPKVSFAEREASYANVWSSSNNRDQTKSKQVKDSVFKRGVNPVSV